jgi:homoserine dehydrogenase
MQILEQFRSEVEAFLVDKEMQPTEFGRQTLGDPNFVFDIRDGREPRLATIGRVRNWMREQQSNAA